MIGSAGPLATRTTYGVTGHSNIFCTPIFVLGQDESQGTTPEIADGQKSNCLLAGQESTSHFI